MFGNKKKQTIPELEQQIRRGGAGLSGLDIPDFSQIDWSKPIEYSLKDKFRDETLWSLTAEESDRQFINEVIYEGGTVQIMGRFRHSQKTYNEIRRHSEGDRRVCELLLEEAMRTGQWKVLPEVLWQEYHERMGMDYPC